MNALSCYIAGLAGVVSVEIDTSETVSALKNKIKEKMPSTIRVDASHLKLYPAYENWPTLKMIKERGVGYYMKTYILLDDTCKLSRYVGKDVKAIEGDIHVFAGLPKDPKPVLTYKECKNCILGLRITALYSLQSARQRFFSVEAQMCTTGLRSIVSPNYSSGLTIITPEDEWPNRLFAHGLPAKDLAEAQWTYAMVTILSPHDGCQALEGTPNKKKAIAIFSSTFEFVAGASVYAQREYKEASEFAWTLLQPLMVQTEEQDMELISDDNDL